MTPPHLQACQPETTGVIAAHAGGRQPAATALRLAAPTLHVDGTTIAANSRACAALSPGFMAVVKADGYGHGTEDVAHVALANGAGCLGVATIPEALDLRSVGLDAPILAWLSTPTADYAGALLGGIDLAVSDPGQLAAIAKAAAHTGRTARVHLFADTGMTREGCPAAEWRRLCADSAAAGLLGTVKVVGIMSHLACADQPAASANTSALAAFHEACLAARDLGLRPGLRHIAATHAAISMPSTRLDLARIGAGLYGIDCPAAPHLRRALTLTAPLALVRRADAGTRVGYGLTYQVDRPTHLGVIHVGYADGLPAGAQGQAFVLVNGRRCPVVGRINMDQIVIDLGDMAAETGTPAVLFGPGDDGEPTTADWASWAAIPERELVCGLGRRLQRHTLPAGRRREAHHLT